MEEEAPPNRFSVDLAPGCGRLALLGGAGLVVLIALAETGLSVMLFGIGLGWLARRAHRATTPFADGVAVTGAVTNVTKRRRTSGGLRFPVEARYLYGANITYRNPITGTDQLLEPRSFVGHRHRPGVGDTVELSVSASDPSEVRIIGDPTPMVLYAVAALCVALGLWQFAAASGLLD